MVETGIGLFNQSAAKRYQQQIAGLGIGLRDMLNCSAK
jgi:hypothetical protein